MLYTDLLKEQRTTKDEERKYIVAFYEFNRGTHRYEYVHITHVNSCGAHMAVTFDSDTTKFCIDSITPM